MYIFGCKKKKIRVNPIIIDEFVSVIIAKSCLSLKCEMDFVLQHNYKVTCIFNSHINTTGFTQSVRVSLGIQPFYYIFIHDLVVSY